MSQNTDTFNYQKPYAKFATAKDVIIPDHAIGEVLILPNDPIQGGSPFQPQDRMAFSPLPTDPLSIEGLALFLLIANFAKTPEGQKSLERIVLKYLDSCARIIESVQDASHSNWLTALNNQHITATISHRIGLIDDAGYIKVLDHYRSVFDKMLQTEWLGTAITGVTTLVQGAKTTNTYQERTGEHTGTSETSTASGIGLLHDILGIKKALG